MQNLRETVKAITQLPRPQPGPGVQCTTIEQLRYEKTLRETFEMSPVHNTPVGGAEG